MKQLTGALYGRLRYQSQFAVHGKREMSTQFCKCASLTVLTRCGEHKDSEKQSQRAEERNNKILQILYRRANLFCGEQKRLS